MPDTCNIVQRETYRLVNSPRAIPLRVKWWNYNTGQQAPAHLTEREKKHGQYVKICSNITDVLNAGVSTHMADMLTWRQKTDSEGKKVTGVKEVKMDFSNTNNSVVKIIQSMNCLKILRGPIDVQVPGTPPAFCYNPRSVKKCECKSQR